jgi:hypothetical protein
MRMGAAGMSKGPAGTGRACERRAEERTGMERGRVEARSEVGSAHLCVLFAF